MDDSFNTRVDKIFGSLQSSQSSPLQQQRPPLWSVTDDEVERREWRRDSAADREEVLCSSSFREFLQEERRYRSGRLSRKELEDDLDNDDDDEDDGDSSQSRSRRIDGGGDEWEIRSFIGMDSTLDNEEEEDEYDKVASGRENAGERLYMSDIADHGSYWNSQNVLHSALNRTSKKAVPANRMTANPSNIILGDSQFAFTKMSSFKTLPTLSFLFVTLFSLAHAATFDIRNNCPYTVWAAAVPGGGRPMNRGETWQISAAPGTTQARIWARTNCQFDASGRGKCQTGDCGGVLECKGYGSPPNTLAEYAIGQFANQDFIDISNIDGFNVPMEFSSNSPGCTRVIKCTADIVGQCPNELKVPGGCNGPCPVFKTEEHCCNSGNCGPTNFSKFFKDRCPDAYSYPKDDPTSLFTCPTGTNYKVIFCP